MAELTTAQKLVEAKSALHALLTGQQMVEVGYGERRVKYTQTNITQLRSYIAELELATGARTEPLRRPLKVIY